MEIFIWIVCILWVAGFLHELAATRRDIEEIGYIYATDYEEYLMWLVIFLTWPYFAIKFYGKGQ